MKLKLLVCFIVLISIVSSFALRISEQGVPEISVRPQSLQEKSSELDALPVGVFNEFSVN